MLDRFRRGRRHVRRHGGRLRRRRVRAHARAVARAPPRRGRGRHEGALVSDRRQGSRPTACARRATRACAASASTSSTSTRYTRPTRTCRWRRRSRRSTGSCGPARCARSARRTSRPGCSPGRSRCRTATAGRRSSSLQPQYSLVERSIEIELLPFCRAAGLGVHPVGAARRRLPDRPLLARRSRRPRAAAWPSATDDLEEAPHRRAIERNFRVVDEARGDRRGARRDRRAGRDRLAARRRGRDRADRRAADARAARGPARRRGPSKEDERERLEAPAPPPDVYPQRMLIEQSGLPERIILPLRRAARPT